MIMNTNNFSPVLLSIFLFINLAISASTNCNCSGPLKYYEELGCTPIFKNPGDCCAVKYNCDGVKSLPVDKCFINGHTYEIGESLKAEDTNPCDIGCACTIGSRGPEFNCAIVDCFFGPTSPGCYMKRNATECCSSGVEICPDKPEDRPTCVVDGKIYKDGEYFNPANEPEKSCYCGEGYTGENIEPFCVLPKHSWCGAMLRHADDIRENCIPTYYHSQSPKTDCSVAYRCQNDRDTVISKSTNSANQPKSAMTETTNSEMQCMFGNFTMQVGDELNQATDYSSVCVKCVCEVPPIPTCQRLADDKCDVTKHDNFNRR